MAEVFDKYWMTMIPTMRTLMVLTEGDLYPLKHKYSFDEDDNLHRIDVFNSSGAVGFIEWDADSGEIEKVAVGTPNRRKGVATELWDLATAWAEENGAEPPSHSSRRSADGDAWARSIGGHVPDLTDDIDGWSTR
jgi:hypothetical protein